jgi:hypothetical protein
MLGRRRLASLLAAQLAACAGGPSPSPVSPAAATPTPGPTGNVRFTIDSGVNRHPISPYVYGTNQPDWAGKSRGLRLGRLGGNRWTAYNWETNASNAGADYRHQNDDFLGGGNVAGEAVRPQVAAAHAAGASMVVTVPMAGYVSADKNPPNDVNQTPDYLAVRFLESRARKGARLAYPPETGDRVVYQDEFVAWLESAFPGARQDPTRTLFYSLDNEPDLWASTHPRIRPQGKITYDEIVSRTVEWAGAIKGVAPGALVFGAVNYGWNGYVSLQDAPDRGGRDFLDFFLDAMREAEGRSGRRLVDVLDLHWYPEARGGGVRITEADASPAVAAARVQAPRSLWDPGYAETSWISVDARVGPIRLIPRMREKLQAHYPGTRLAFTEYNYGGGSDVSGAIAQADVLGIFGREDVFAAALWELTGASPFTSAGFAAFCNYDGAGARFGDTSIGAASSNAIDASVYASVDDGRDDRLVVVAINKTSGPLVAEILITHPVDLTRGQSFQVSAASATPARGPEVTSTARNAFRITLAPSSVTTVALLR